MQFHWIGSIFGESEISETLCCWFDRNVLLQGSEVKPAPAQIMIIYQYEYNPPPTWFIMQRESEWKWRVLEWRNILYELKMIYALIKRKMLRWGVLSRKKTERSSHSDYRITLTWLRGLIFAAVREDLPAWLAAVDNAEAEILWVNHRNIPIWTWI